jgi:hypothetical protein
MKQYEPYIVTLTGLMISVNPVADRETAAEIGGR